MKKVIIYSHMTEPKEICLVNISESEEVNYGAFLVDKAGELPTLLVLSDTSMAGIDVKTEEATVNKIIQGLPEYQMAKAQELPCPTCDADEKSWKTWNDSFRLALCPHELYTNQEILDFFTGIGEF
jgi:hypothetical protein